MKLLLITIISITMLTACSNNVQLDVNKWVCKEVGIYNEMNYMTKPAIMQPVTGCVLWQRIQ